MKLKLLLLCVVGASAGLLAACSSNDSGAGAAPVSKGLDTPRVLALAEQSSETSYPFAVNGGAVTITDSSETTVPLMFSVM